MRVACEIWGGQAGVCGCGGEGADEVKVLKRKGKTTNGRARKGEEGEEGMEPGSSVSWFRHYMGAVSGWQCRDEERGSLRVLPIVACCVANGYREVEWLARGPPTVRWLA